MATATPRTIRVHLVALIISAALPLLGVLIWGFWGQLDRERLDARDLALRIAQSLAGDLTVSNARADELLARMAERPHIRVADPQNCDALFPIVDFFPQYLNLQLYEVSGTLLCSATPQPEDAKLSKEAEGWIVSVLRAGKGIPAGPTLLPLEGRWISVTFRRVQMHGLTTGVLALVQYIDFNLDAYPPGTVVTVVDDEGRVVARSQDASRWIGRNVKDASIARSVLAGGAGQVATAGIDGTLRQYGFTAVKGTPWHIYVGIPQDVAMASVRRLLAKGIVAGLLIVGIVVALSLRLARSIERPLDALAAAAQRVEDDGYSSVVPADGPREIAFLGHAFNRMVARRAEADAQLRESRNRLEALSQRLLDVQEEERTRIAREIHDELGQLLTALKMDVGGLIDSIPGEERPEPMIGRIRLALEETVTSIHRIASELRPPVLDDFGFLAALESDVRTFEKRTGIECELSLPTEPLALPTMVETAAYRIVQEAMTNVARHANAGRIEIRLRTRPGEVLLDVRDDGRGVASSDLQRRDALGIVGMRERARQIGGTLDVQGIPGRGTIVSLRIPIAAGEGGQ